jgi:hypothetical protein
MHRRVLAVIVPLLLVSVVPTATSAGTDVVRLAIQPSDGSAAGFVTLTLDPGGSRRIAIELVNTGTVSVRARTYAADAYSLVNGGFGARLEAEPHSGPTGWLTYPPETIDLAPGDHIQRAFTVAVPAGTEAGEYLSALVLQNESPISVEGSSGVQQVIRGAMAVLVQVPGPRHPALEIAGVDHTFVAGTSVVGFGATNPGNARLRPDAAFEVRTEDGRQVGQLEAPLDSIYAGTSTRVEIPLAAELAAGRYVARLVLSDIATSLRVDSGWLPFVVGEPPQPRSSLWPQLLLLALVVLVALAIGLWRRRRYLRSKGR